MTNVLKHGQDALAQPVRTLDWGALSGDQGKLNAAPAIDPEILELRAEAARLVAELSDLKAAEPTLIAAARAEGRKEAETAHKADNEARLDALRTGLEAAIEAARPAFANIEKVAVLLVERALANAFDDPGHYRDQITRAVRKQAALIGEHTILKLEVSAADFNDDQTLSDLANGLGPGRVEILAIDTLKKGRARLRLTLGEVEIDLPRYWSDVRALLSDLVESP